MPQTISKIKDDLQIVMFRGTPCRTKYTGLPPSSITFFPPCLFYIYKFQFFILFFSGSEGYMAGVDPENLDLSQTQHQPPGTIIRKVFNILKGSC